MFRSQHISTHLIHYNGLLLMVFVSKKMFILNLQSPTPPQYVYWQKNDRMINYDDSRRDISIDTTPGPRTQSRLIIREPQISDSGNYTCSASNTEPASIYVFVSKGKFFLLCFNECMTEHIRVKHTLMVCQSNKNLYNDIAVHEYQRFFFLHLIFHFALCVSNSNVRSFEWEKFFLFEFNECMMLRVVRDKRLLVEIIVDYVTSEENCAN